MPKDLKWKHATIQMRSPQIKRTHCLQHTSYLPKNIILTNSKGRAWIWPNHQAYLNNSKWTLCNYLLQQNMNMLWLTYIFVLSVEQILTLLQSYSSEVAKNVLNFMYSTWEVPIYLSVNRIAHFTRNVIKELCKALQLAQKLCCAYNLIFRQRRKDKSYSQISQPKP